jgi:hypothetical protein
MITLALLAVTIDNRPSFRTSIHPEALPSAPWPTTTAYQSAQGEALGCRAGLPYKRHGHD